MDITTLKSERKYFRVTNSFRRNIWGFIFALPATLLFVVFAAYPILQTFLFSFYDYDLGGEKIFTGLENYSYILKNQVFQESFFNTIFYAVGTYLPTLVIALLIAMALNARIPARGTLRMVNFVPVVISWVIVAVIWKLLFHQNGLVNQFLGNFNIDPINWLLSEESAMWAIIIPSIWKEIGFFMVIFLAGLQTIPHEYYEASQIDGANRLQSFQHITLPLLRPTMVLAIILAIINGMKVFIPTFVMTQGGPAGTTRVLSLIIYQTAFSYNRIGRASAMAVVLFLAILSLTLIQSRIYGTRRD